MSRFITMSFDIKATSRQTNKMIQDLQDFLEKRGATEILITRSSDSTDDDEEEE